MTDANTDVDVIESQVNMVQEIFFEKAHTLFRDQRFFDALNTRITQAIDDKLDDLDITMEKKSELREYMLNDTAMGLLMNGERKNVFINHITNEKESIKTFFGEFINELLSGTDDQLIEHLVDLFYRIFVEPDAINNLHSKINMGNTKAFNTVSGSMPGCKVTGCLDGLIGGSNLSKAEFNTNNSVSYATGASGSNGKGASGSNMDNEVNYQRFGRVLGWDGMTSIALPGTEDGGCKDAMDINSSKELCNNSPECDGFFAYARNDSDRVCFKTNVDTSNNVKTSSEQKSAFFVKDDRVNGNNPPGKIPNPESELNEDGTWYIPLNGIDGEPRSESSWQECQQRCLDTKGCIYFNAFQDGGCHLTDGRDGTAEVPNNPTIKSGKAEAITNFQSGGPEPFSNIEKVDGNKDFTIDDNVFGNIMTTLLFIILVYYFCKKLKLF